MGPKHCRRTTPKNDDSRLKKIDGVAEPNGEILQRLFEDFFRERIVALRGFSNHFTANCGRTPAGEFHDLRAKFRRLREPFSGAARDRRARSKNFDASLFPAIANGAIEVDRNVTTFRGRAGTPVKNFSIKHDASADSCANRREKDVPVPTASAPEMFGETASIGVIVHFDVRGIVFGHFVGKRKIAPARNVRWIDDDSSARVKWAGCTYADAFNFRAAGRILREQRFDGGKNGGEPLLGRCTTIHRRARVRKNLSLRVHNASGYFRAADIHAYHSLRF